MRFFLRYSLGPAISDIRCPERTQLEFKPSVPYRSAHPVHTATGYVCFLHVSLVMFCNWPTGRLIRYALANWPTGHRKQVTPCPFPVHMRLRLQQGASTWRVCLENRESPTDAQLHATSSLHRRRPLGHLSHSLHRTSLKNSSYSAFSPRPLCTGQEARRRLYEPGIPNTP